MIDKRISRSRMIDKNAGARAGPPQARGLKGSPGFSVIAKQAMVGGTTSGIFPCLLPSNHQPRLASHNANECIVARWLVSRVR